MSRGTSKTIQSSKNPSDIFDPTNFTFNQDSPVYRDSDTVRNSSTNSQMMMAWKDIPYDQGIGSNKNRYIGDASYADGIMSGTFLSLGGATSRIYDTNTAAGALFTFPDYLQCPEFRFNGTGGSILISFRPKLSAFGSATGVAVIGSMTLGTPWDISTLNKGSLKILEFPDTANPEAVANYDMNENGVNYFRPYHKIRFGDNGSKMYLMECSGTKRGVGTTANSTRIFQYTLSTPNDIETASYDGYQDFEIGGLFDSDNPVLNFEIVPHPEAAINNTSTMIYFFGPNRPTASGSSCTLAYWGFNNSGRWDITNSSNISSGPSSGLFYTQLPDMTSLPPRYVRDVFFADSGNKLFVVAAPNAGGDTGGLGFALYGYDLTSNSASYVDQYNLNNSTKTALQSYNLGSVGNLTREITSGVWNGFKAHDLKDGFKPLYGGGGDLSFYNRKGGFGVGYSIGANFQFDPTGNKLFCMDLNNNSAEAFSPRLLEYSLFDYDPTTVYDVANIIPRLGYGFQIVGVAPKETYNHKYISWTPPSFAHSWKGQHNTGHMGFYLVEFEDNDTQSSALNAYGPAFTNPVSNDVNKYKVKKIPGFDSIISDGVTTSRLPLCAKMKPDGTQLWVFSVGNETATDAASDAQLRIYNLQTAWDISTLQSTGGTFSFTIDDQDLYPDTKPRDWIYMWFNNTGTQVCISGIPFENADQTQSAGSVFVVELDNPWTFSGELPSVTRIDNLRGSSGTFFGQEGNYITAAEFTKDGTALWFQMNPIRASLNTGKVSSINLLHLDTPNDITTINTSNSKKITGLAATRLLFDYEPSSPGLGLSATSSDGVTAALNASPRFSGYGYSYGRSPSGGGSVARKSAGSLQFSTSYYSGFDIEEVTEADSYRGLPLGQWDSGLVFSPDGRYVYTNSNKYTYQMTLKRPFDIQSRYEYGGKSVTRTPTSISYVYGPFEVYGSIARPIAFNPDGTRFFWTRQADDYYNRLTFYSSDLTTPWDISTLNAYTVTKYESESTFSGPSGGDTGGLGEYEVVGGFGGCTHFEFSPDGRKIIANWTFNDGPSYQRNYMGTYRHTKYFVLDLDEPFTLPGLRTDDNLSSLQCIRNGDFTGDYSTVFTMNATGDKILSFDPINGTATSFHLNTPYVFGSSLNSTIASKQMYPNNTFRTREFRQLDSQQYIFKGLARVGIDKLMLLRGQAGKTGSLGVVREGNNAYKTRQAAVDLIDLNGTYGFMG